MSRGRYEDELLGHTEGRNSPRGGSRKVSRDHHWEYDSSPESERKRDRPSRKMSIRDRNFFTDALDELEVNIRKFEEESNVLLHDFNVIRNQHLSQGKRINDLLRNFEESRYRIDRINSRGYRSYGSDHASDTSSEHRGSVHSLDRGERPGSFREERSRGHKSRSRRMDSPSDRDHHSKADADN